MTNSPKTCLLTNDFHRTSYRVRLSPSALDARKMDIVSGCGSPSDRAWARRVWRRLCGVADCECARTFLGER